MSVIRIESGDKGNRAGEKIVWFAHSGASGLHQSNQQTYKRGRRSPRYQIELIKSAGVVQAGGDAVDGRAQRVVEHFGVGAGAFAAEQLDLDQAHGIDVRIAQAD